PRRPRHRTRPVPRREGQQQCPPAPPLLAAQLLLFLGLFLDLSLVGPVFGPPLVRPPAYPRPLLGQGRLFSGQGRLFSGLLPPAAGRRGSAGTCSLQDPCRPGPGSPSG